MERESKSKCVNVWPPAKRMLYLGIRKLRKTIKITVMKNRNELVEQVGREILNEGINLERDWNFGEVNGKRSIIEENYAKARSGRYNGVDGFYFNRADGFEFDSDEQESITEIMDEYGFTVIDFSPWEMEEGEDRSHRASVSFVKYGE